MSEVEGELALFRICSVDKFAEALGEGLAALQHFIALLL